MKSQRKTTKTRELRSQPQADASVSTDNTLFFKKLTQKEKRHLLCTRLGSYRPPDKTPKASSLQGFKTLQRTLHYQSTLQTQRQETPGKERYSAHQTQKNHLPPSGKPPPNQQALTHWMLLHSAGVYVWADPTVLKHPMRGVQSLSLGTHLRAKQKRLSSMECPQLQASLV